MVITFKGIFIPSEYTDKPNSYFIVTPQTYKNVVGFLPVTYDEYFGIKGKLKLNDEYMNKNEYFTDKVNLYSYEVIYSDMIHKRQRERIMEMINTLEKEGRIVSVNLDLDVKEGYLDETEVKKRRIKIGDTVRIREDLIPKAYNEILYNKPLMSEYEGKITTVVDIQVKGNREYIKLEIDNQRFAWGKDMLVKINDKRGD